MKSICKKINLILLHFNVPPNLAIRSNEMTEVLQENERTEGKHDYEKLVNAL